MKIKVTTVYVDDQVKALRFYTESLGFTKNTDFSQGPYRWLTNRLALGAKRHGAATGADNNPTAKTYQQATEPARDHVVDQRHQGRLRAVRARCRVHDAADRRDLLDHCHAEGYLWQPGSDHPAGTLVGRPFRAAA